MRHADSRNSVAIAIIKRQELSLRFALTPRFAADHAVDRPASS